MYSIETKGLTYRFSKDQTVLNNIDLKVPIGSIYGFLGPNGAGKTTTLRLLLGLLKKQEGIIKIFDKDFDQNRIEVLKKIGSLIEAPSLYGHLTAVENLTILQKIYQCPIARIKEVLDTVGLSQTGNKKASQFSLGMKQRLSIAIALLHDPTLLILDEPTNGLDPNGIIEIRALLKKLNSENKTTIVISSHLLSEIEKIVSHLVIIDKGSVLFQGTLEELHLKQALASSTCFNTNDNQRAISLIHSNGFNAEINNDQIVLQSTDRDTISKLNEVFVKNGISVFQINSVRNDLESIFIDMVKN